MLDDGLNVGQTLVGCLERDEPKTPALTCIISHNPCADDLSKLPCVFSKNQLMAPSITPSHLLEMAK